jgi:hypothetical protein
MTCYDAELRLALSLLKHPEALQCAPNAAIGCASSRRISSLRDAEAHVNSVGARVLAGGNAASDRQRTD